MRIGIVGHAGSGKSTLASDLAAALGVPLIPDATLEALREHHGRTSWRGIKDTRIRRTIRLAALEKKIADEKAAESFVSDKTVVDYLAYWLQNQAEFETPEQTRSVIETVRAHAGRYERCVFLPYRESVDFAEDRSADPVHNMKVAGLERGLLSIFGVPTVEAPYTFGEDVGAWIERWLAPPPAPPAPPAKGAKRAKGRTKPAAG